MAPEAGRVAASGWPLAGVLALALVPAGGGCGGRDRSDSLDPAPRAYVLRERRVGPRFVDLAVRSPALGADGMVRLMVPPGWSAQRKTRRWPVLYLLHGCCDTYESWTRSTHIAELPQLRDVLVVMPEAGQVGFYSDWVGTRRGRGPAWETFHLTELRQILERDYGAGRVRAIAGLSMGGLGAMAYAARHPGLFRAAASFSGLLHPLGDPPFLLRLFSHYTPDAQAIWGDPGRDRAVWARHDPTELAAALRGTRLFVSSGDGRPGPFDAAGREPDAVEPQVLAQSRAFVERLEQLGIPAEIDFYGPGMHDWPYWERELERALPLLLGAVGRR